MTHLFLMALILNKLMLNLVTSWTKLNLSSLIFYFIYFKF
jgi:hypothetical protein